MIDESNMRLELWELDGYHKEYELPKNFKHEDRNLFPGRLYRSPVINYIAYKNTFITRKGLIIDGDNILIESFPTSYKASKSINLKSLAKVWLAKRCLGRRASSLDEIVWLIDTWSLSFYHWFCEFLPKLLIAREVIGEFDVWLPEAAKNLKFVEPSLEALGVKTINYLDSVYLTKVNRLLIFTSVGNSGSPDPRVLLKLRKIYRVDGKTRRRVYISRKLAERRRVVNEEEVISVVKRFGFEVHHLETMSWVEQVNVCSEANVLVSNHGAGLSNMLYMHEDSKVLELRKEGDAHHNCFYQMASALDHQYYYQLCEAEDPQDSGHLTDVKVNCELLDETLTLMLGS